MGCCVKFSYFILVVWNDYENKVTKFNTTTQEVSEVGNRYNRGGKWSGGALHPNGYDLF